MFSRVNHITAEYTFNAKLDRLLNEWGGWTDFQNLSERTFFKRCCCKMLQNPHLQSNQLFSVTRALHNRVTTCSAICPVVVFASPAPRIHGSMDERAGVAIAVSLAGKSIAFRHWRLRDSTEYYWNILKHQAGKFTPFTVHLQTCKIQSYVYKLRTQSFQIVVLSLAWNLNEHLIARTSCTVGWNWCWLLRIAGNPKLITVA